MIYMFAENTCFNVLCSYKVTLLSKMAKLVWRYSYDARVIIENVYKTARRKRICSKKDYPLEAKNAPKN